MTPSARFNAWVATTTVAIMYLIVTMLVPRLEAWGSLGVTVAGGLMAFGVYRLIGSLVRWAMGHWIQLNKWILGPSYVHGTWIGIFVGRAGDVRFMIEHFEQNLEGVVISGRSYTNSLATHAFWHSRMASIDAKEGRLLFWYDFDIVSRDKPLSGIHVSKFQRSAPSKSPTALAGFAHDLNDRNRVAVQSFKVSDELLEWEVALLKAQEKLKQQPNLALVARAPNK